MLIDGQVGDRSGIPVINIKIVIRAVFNGGVGHIDGAAPDLDAVIITPLYGNIINNRAASDAHQ